MTDTATVVGEILAGAHDAHALEIVKAVQMRMAHGHVATYWRLRWDDLEVTEQSITVGEVRDVENLLSAAQGEKVSWLSIDPRSSSSHFIAVLGVVLQSRRGMSLVEATKAIEEMPMGELNQRIDEYELTSPPKD